MQEQVTRSRLIMLHTTLYIHFFFIFLFRPSSAFSGGKRMRKMSKSRASI